MRSSGVPAETYHEVARSERAIQLYLRAHAHRAAGAIDEASEDLELTFVAEHVRVTALESGRANGARIRRRNRRC